MNEKVEQQEESQEGEHKIIIAPSEEARVTGLFGEIDEDSAAGCISSFLSLKEKGISEDEEGNMIFEPFEFIISTEGGHVSEMFAIYDMMRSLKSEGIEIHTCGLGKVMSAGVLLLAAGTQGKRRIGKNTQIMIHDISSGHFGSMREIQNDAKQIRRLRDLYVDSLIEETKITKRKINNILNKHIDIYFSAEEALEIGIVDEIF